MARAAITTKRTSGFELSLTLAVAVSGLLALAFISAVSEDFADVSPLGGPGTAIAAGVIAALTLVGGILARRGGTGAIRMTFAVTLSVAAGLVTALAWLFLFHGGVTANLVWTLIPIAVSIGLIARAVLRSPNRSER